MNIIFLSKTQQLGNGHFLKFQDFYLLLLIKNYVPLKSLLLTQICKYFSSNVIIEIYCHGNLKF